MSSPFCLLFPWLLRTLKLLSLLFPKIPSPCRLSVLPKLCQMSPRPSLRWDKSPWGARLHPYKQGEPHPPLINMINLISFIFSFWEFSFSLPFLGQTSVQSIPKAASSLESKGSEGACCSPSLHFPLLIFPTSPLPFHSMAMPRVSLPSFSNFVKVSSPFFQHAMCSFTESSRKSKGQEEKALP